MVLVESYILQHFKLPNETHFTRRLRTQMSTSSVRMQMDKPVRIIDIELSFFIKEIYGRDMWFKKRWTRLASI